ncbi:MAG: hypothetical protein Q4A23_02530 [bacterium]|nr:hypothetical protein [bacterium]
MKWKIYFLLFGFLSLFSIFTTLEKTALAVESYKISPEDDRTIKRDFYNSLRVEDSENLNMHYYFYTANNYSEDITLIAYVCEYYRDGYDRSSFTTVPDCGLSMVQEAGKFKIKLKASAYKNLIYSRRTQKVDFNSYGSTNIIYGYNNQSEDIASFTDADFEKGLTLLGGSTLKVNNWNRNEGGFLVDPVGGSNQNQNNNNQNNNGGGFDILGGIKSFFQPMIDSIKNIWDFFANFFTKLFEELGKFVRWIFVSSQEELNNELSNIRSMFKFEKITNILNTTYLPLNSVGFSYGSYCSDSYWDATTPHLNSLLNSGDQKYTNGFRLTTSICKVPKIYITLARNLLMFAFFWWAAYRLFQMIPIVMGSAYIWDRWSRKDD